MKIGTVEISDGAALAPMAGVADLAFRGVCREAGAVLTYTEMVSAKAICFGDKKTRLLLALGEDEHPAAVQIFGSDPDCMAKAAPIAVYESGADILDINMGCPTPKIVSCGDGGALMKNPRLAAGIIEAVVKAVSVPVSVKFRLGWDRGSINVLEFARMAEDSGAACICVHGRTCRQLYSGVADLAPIAEVKRAVGIPVIVNGDIISASGHERARRMTGADLVMVGRGAMGNPWLFTQIGVALRGEPEPAPPSLEERCNTAIKQIEKAADCKGERIAVLEARRHFPWYLRGVPHCAHYKDMICKMTTLSEMYKISKLILQDSMCRFEKTKIEH